MRRPPIRRLRLNCFFCQNDTLPNFEEFEVLKKFISDRGRIMSRERSGVCAKHQRHLSREIKRARHLALVPFVG
jgi:small subunit ribosomal protein S18